MNDPRKLSLVDVARELHIQPTHLVKHAQENGWEQLRLNSSNLLTTAQNERRLNRIKIIDERIVDSVDKFSEKAIKQYSELFEKVSMMPTDAKDIPDDQLEKDDHGNVKNKNKNDKLLERKITLWYQTQKGFLEMAAAVKNLGLLTPTNMLNNESTAENLSQLTKLNIMISTIQNKKTEKDVTNVIEINTDKKGTDGE
jgi:hypothetical protein